MKCKYTSEFIDKVRNGATAEELGLRKGQYGHIIRYHIQGKKDQKARVCTGYTGYRAWHSKPIGSERLDKDGYTKVKIGYPRIERMKHHLEWEKYNPPINSKLECIMFLDGDKNNCNIDNLIKVKRKYMGTINKYAPVGLPPDLRRIAIESAGIYTEAKELERKKQLKHKLSVEKKPLINQIVRELYAQGLSLREISERTGLRMSTITWKIRRDRLKKELENEAN